MKRTLLIFSLYLILPLFLFAGSSTANFSLKELNYNDDIYIYGVTSYTDFFYPVYNADDISNAEFSMNYGFTQFVGPDSMYTILVNDAPLYTFYFLDYEGNIRIKIPDKYLEKATLLKVTLAVTLDYSICDSKRIESNALWFRIDRETSLKYQYEPAAIETISAFFSIYNPKKTYHIVTDSPTKNIQAIATMGEHLGYTGKSLEQIPETSFSTSSDVNNIVLTDLPNDETLLLSDELLYLDSNTELYNSLKPLYYNYTPSSSMAILELNERKRDDFVSLSRFGVNDGNISVVYNTKRDYNFSIDSFGGVPQNAELNLNFSVFNRLHDSGNTMTVLLNGYLLKTFHLNDLETLMYSDIIKIPSDYFRAFNTLSFEFKNIRGDCDEYTVKLYPTSPIRFSGVQPLKDVLINDFPNSVYGRTLYVVSNQAENFVDNLLKLSFEKGKAAIFPDRATVLSVDELLSDNFNAENFDSLVFLVEAKDVSRFDPLIALTDAFTLKDNEGEILFASNSNGNFNIVRTFEYEGLPAILFTHYGLDQLNIDERFISRIKKVPGNLGIFTENEMFSFEIGEKSDVFFLEANEKTQNETLLSFWEKYRLWIILIAAALILLVLLVSYAKTSKGR